MIEEEQTKKQPMALPRTGIYLFLNAIYGTTLATPPNVFGKACGDLIEDYRTRLEESLAMHPALTLEELEEQLDIIEDQLLLEVFLPEVASNLDLYDEEQINQMLDEVTDECDENLQYSNYAKFLEYKGIITLENVEDNVPRYTVNLKDYFKQRTELQEEYRDYADNAEQEFEQFEQMAKYHVITYEGMLALALYDMVQEEGCSKSTVLAKRQLEALKIALQPLLNKGRSTYEMSLTQYADAYVANVLKKLEAPRLDSESFEIFEQEKFDEAVQAIYGKGGVSKEEIYARINRDRQAIDQSPYLKFLDEQEIFDDDGYVDFAILAKKKEQIDNDFALKAEEEGFDAKSALRQFDRFMRYQQLCRVHEVVYQRVELQVREMENGRQ